MKFFHFFLFSPKNLVSYHTTTLHRTAEKGPEVQIKGIAAVNIMVELKQPEIARLFSVKATLSDTDSLHVIVPGFHFEEDFGCQKLMFLLFYKYEYEIGGSKENLKGDNFLFII